ncbi:hypothetical protein EVAR_76475_1 [Eumeta japonica]|uniref:Uncharacterized protein n=1 Tax=Eumeta variegata TaxID=151549 RepID=A0A4C1T7I6_EUMVA|nr:hypothetical protein EVAR_76475_1 [Eumeta japonica]
MFAWWFVRLDFGCHDLKLKTALEVMVDHRAKSSETFLIASNISLTFYRRADLDEKPSGGHGTSRVCSVVRLRHVGEVSPRGAARPRANVTGRTRVFVLDHFAGFVPNLIWNAFGYRLAENEGPGGESTVLFVALWGYLFAKKKVCVASDASASISIAIKQPFGRRGRRVHREGRFILKRTNRYRGRSVFRSPGARRLFAVA